MSSNLAGDDGRRVLIRASAGTGKTFRLSNHYLERFLAGAEPETILATTFTRKAAGEIQERLFERLVDAAESDDAAAELGNHLKVAIAADDAARALHRLARRMHRIRVSTLDAFYSKLATAHSLEVGLPSDWRVLDDLDVLPMKLRSIDDVLSAAEVEDAVSLLSLLDKGNTKSRVVSQMLDAVNDYHAIFLDAEGKSQPWDQVPEPPLQSQATIDAAIETLKRLGPRFPHKSGVRGLAGLVRAALSGDWKVVAVSTAVANATRGNGKFHGKDLGDELIEALVTLAQHATGVMLLELRTQNLATYELMREFDLHYRKRKSEAAGLTFTDVTRFLASKIGLTDASRLGFRLDGDIDHLLLDEFQDTSLPQWAILEPISRRTADVANGSVFCVGDLKQAIYGWRGGVAAIFDRVEQLLEVQPATMNLSYRSSPTVIAAVNQLFGNLTAYQRYQNADRVAVESWNDRYEEHSAKKQAEGYVEVRATIQPESPNSAFGSNVRRWTAMFVRDLHEKHPGRTIGVLTRKNSVASEVVAHLRGLGVQASDEGRETLTDSAAVQVLQSLLSLATHPEDSAARFHVANSPLALLSGLRNHEDAIAAAELSQRLREQLVDHGYATTLKHWSEPLIDRCSKRDLARIEQLLALADQFDSSRDPRPEDFLRLVSETQSGDPTPALIRVMTVHQSKGLEFDIVVLTELDTPCYQLERSGYVAARPTPTSPPDRILRYRGKEERAHFPPPVREVFDEAATAEMAEALCRFYVAATRAESALYFLIAPDREKKSNGGNSDTVTPAQLVRALLCEDAAAEPGACVHAFGDPDWDTPDATAEVAADLVPTPVPLPSRTPGGSRDLETTSPSALVRHGARRQPEQRSVDFTFDGTAAERGSLIHRWFEEIEWIETTGVPSDERCSELANWLDVTPSIVRSETARFRKFLATESLQTLLNRLGYERVTGRTVREVRNEVRFSVRQANQLVIGTIDRLCFFEATDAPSEVQAEVIDWKTDFIADETQLREKIEHYRPQLAAYCEAVAQLFELEVGQVAARLVFVNADRDIALTPESMSVEVAAALPKVQPGAQPSLFEL